MHRMNVVLPEPDAPMTTTTSWRLTVTVTPLRTCSCPKYLWTSVASTTIFSRVCAPPIASRMSPSTAVISDLR